MEQNMVQKCECKFCIVKKKYEYKNVNANSVNATLVWYKNV